MPTEGAASLPLRVLLVLPDQWPRALLRAALREAGYDALGAPSLDAALLYPAEDEERGPVRAILVDQATLTEPEADAILDTLLQRHGRPATVLLAHSAFAYPHLAPTAASRWQRIVQRPASIADLVGTVEALLPLPPASARPQD